MFIVEDNSLWHYGSPSDHTGSHGNFSQGRKIHLITHPKPFYGHSGYLFFLDFRHFLIFMNMQMRYRPLASIKLYYDITGSIQNCYNELEPKIGLFIDLHDFSGIFIVFIKIHEYAN